MSESKVKATVKGRARHTLALRVITQGVPVVKTDKARNWGDSARETRIQGTVLEVAVERDNELQFGLRIMENGRLILTDYAHMGYQTSVPQNLTLEPTHPWKG